MNLFVILLVSGLISLPARPCGVFRPILRLHVVRRILNKGPDTRRIALRMGSKITAVFSPIQIEKSEIVFYKNLPYEITSFIIKKIRLAFVP